MINLSKSSSSLVVTSDDKNVFPFKDGTLSLPMNSLYFVLDESNYVSFKQATDNNQLFGASINDLTINGTPATKENIIALFDSVANSTNSGGGGEGGAVSSVNGQTGAVVITPQNIGTYTSAQIDTKVNAKQDTLVSGTNIKTINGETILGEGDITITSTPTSVEWNDVQNKPNFATVATSGDYNDLTNKPEIPSLEGYATESFVTTAVSGESTERQKQDTALGGMIAAETEAREAADSAINQTIATKQDTLVSGTNIKTINGASILGEGNISIETPEGGISDAPKDGNTYARKDGAWTAITIPSLDGYLTETAADGKYQPKGNYLTEVPSEYVTDTELNGKGYLTSQEASETYQPIGDYALKSELPSTANLVTTEELNEAISGKANTSDLSNYLTKTDAESTYAKETSLEGLESSKLDVSTYNQDKATFALKSELPDTSDMLTKTEASSTYQAKGDYITTTVADGKYQVKGDYLTEIPSEYVTDSELSGKGYITETAADGKYQPKGEYATDEELSGKQDTLIAGQGINIQGSTISTTLSNEWFGSQQEYDELEVKDANTLYYISE